MAQRRGAAASNRTAVWSRFLTARELAKFTALVALFAILADATVGHGLSWENDPYWTYWVTKTFLIATIFGIGTALVGIGRLRGALITLVHTLILTIYYWALSPIGLPSSPNWLDLEHTWITGVPIHFGVIYLGYLTALWIWRRRTGPVATDLTPAALGLRALGLGVIIVLVAGGLSNIALGEFTGITWFLVRLLITVPFLLIWWGIVGRDRIAAIVGGLVLAFIWAAYSQYLGPVGLPDIHHLRLFAQAAPPSPVHWLDYNQLWLISFPIYLVGIVSLLSLDAYWLVHRSLLAPVLAVSVIATAAVVVIAALVIPDKDKSSQTKISATGAAMVENGAYYGNQFKQGAGQISIMASNDGGGRVSPLPPHDKVNIKATIQSNDHKFTIVADEPMVDDPMGQFTTWWGVGFDVTHHGRTGIGTNKLPAIKSKLAVFGMGDVMMDGKLIASGVSIHAMTAEKGLAKNSHLELDVGDSRLANPLPAVANGHLRVLWPNYQGTIPGESNAWRYAGGGIVLAVLVLAGLVANSPAWANYRLRA